MKMLYPFEVKTKEFIINDIGDNIGELHKYSIEDEEFVYYFKPVFEIEINSN